MAPASLAPVWDRVLVEVRTPEPGRLTRLLRWLHVPEVDVVVLRASGNLVVALAVAVSASLGFALVAAQLSHDRQQLAWLAIAPLLPALLVAGAYDSTDPIRELADADAVQQAADSAAPHAGRGPRRACRWCWQWP